jgi:hypothetical protein
MAATAHDTTRHNDHLVGTTNTRVISHHGDETKHSFKTTEILVLVASVAGVLVAAAMDDSLNTQWAWILISALAIGYMLSRGLAKSGSRHDDND